MGYFFRKNRDKVVIGGILTVVATVLFTLTWNSDNTVKGKSIDENIVWAIGEPDGLSIEFMAGEREEVEFVLEEDNPSEKFPGSHRGALTSDGEISKKPYRIIFDMPDDQEWDDSYLFKMDLFYNTGSPSEIEVAINGNRGIFPVHHELKEDLNDSQGNSPLLAKQQLNIPINSQWLKDENNEIVIIPLGIGQMSYDALSLLKAETPNSLINKPRLKPTVFFKNNGKDMTQVAKLEVPFDSNFKEGEATVVVGEKEIGTSLKNNGYDFGVLTKKINIPAIDNDTQVDIEINLDDTNIKAAHEFQAAKRWTLFVTPRVHNDVGYTDLQPHVNELDNRNTDRIMEVLDQYPFYKFNFETSWLVENYIESRTKDFREKFFEHSSAGRAPINALYLNLLTGLSSGEELHRATYFSYKLHKEEGANFDWASLTDAPSHSWFLPTLLTDIGIKGFAVGSNQTRAPILRFSDMNEKSPFYWEGMNGEKILKWYSRSYLQLARLTRLGGDWGGGANYDFMKSTVPQFLTRYQTNSYVPDAVMMYGSYVDNALIPEDADARIIEKWNEEYAYPEIRTASDSDFYDYIDNNFKEDLETYRGGAGAYWEDGAGSTAKATKLIQETQEILPMAETAASLSSVFMPRHRYKSEVFNEIWKNILFYNEHTWGAYSSISQPEREFVTKQWEIKENYAEKADISARTMLTRSLNRLSQLFEVDGNTHFAYNWQPWERSNPIELELSDSEYLVDLEKDEPVEYDVLYENNGYRKIRFIAEDVPAMGYKGYAIRSLQDPVEQQEERIKVPDNIAENKYYKLTIDKETGGISSLIDKSEGKEMADAESSYGLNEYLYVSGGENSKVLNHGMGLPPADLTINRPGSARIVENVETAVGHRIVVETSSMNTPTIRSEYRLYDNMKRIDLINTIQKKSTYDKEGVYFAFPFNIDQPEVAYQIQNGWLRPNKDQLPGAAREWFTTQNLVKAADNNGYTIAWATPDAPLFTLTDINRGKWPEHLDINNGHVFSYILNNYWFTNYKASQGGEFEFSYSITSGNNLSNKELAQFDADIRKPIKGYSLLSTWSAATVKAENRPLSPEKGSFIDIESSNLQFITLKKAEMGEGYILRLRETNGTKGQTKISSSHFEIKEAYLTNGVEENNEELEVSNNTIEVPFEKNNFITVRLNIESKI